MHDYNAFNMIQGTHGFNGSFFAPSVLNPADVIAAHYNPVLVVFSFLIAVVASYVSLFLFSRINEKDGIAVRAKLLAVSGIAMGGGIFSMHFVGMLAFHVPLDVKYDAVITIFSLLLAVVGSVFALFVVCWPVSGGLAILYGGLGMGLAIAGMHYLGMAAMVVNASVVYSPGLFWLSLFLAVAVSMLALRLMLSLKWRETSSKQLRLLLTAIFMGLAVCGMHYTGMEATIFLRTPLTEPFPIDGFQDSTLALLITTVFTGVLSLSVIFSFRIEVEDKKRSEGELKRLATAIEQSTQGVLMTDVSGRITYANPAFERITGYGAASVLGKTPAVLKSGRHDAAFYADVWKTILSGQTWSGTFFNKRKDGSLYEENCIITPVVNDGQIVSFVAVKNDITTENIMRRIKDRFTTVISHELLTPLGKLQVAGILLDDLISQKAGPNALVKTKEMISSSFGDFTRIALDTTLFAKLSVGTHQKVFAPIFLYHLLDSCLAGTRAMISREGRHVEIIADLSTVPYDLRIMGNHEMITVAVNKVLSNAVKYTPDDKPVHFSVTLMPETVVLTVRDEGVGIPQEFLATIFEPYHSLDDPMKHSTSQYALKGGGMGLGLSITRLIMDYHAGEIQVQSDGVGKGTTVVMAFSRNPEK